MKKKTLIGIYIVTVIAAVIVGLLLSTIVINLLQGVDLPIPIPPEYLPAFRFALTLKTIITCTNLALIFLMLGIYVDLYRKIKTNFTAGLLLLIIVLLLNSLTANPVLFLRFEGAVIIPGMGFIIPEIFTTIALTVLFYLSLE